MIWEHRSPAETCFYCNSNPIAYVKDIKGVSVATCSKCINVADDVLLNKKLYGKEV